MNEWITENSFGSERGFLFVSMLRTPFLHAGPLAPLLVLLFPTLFSVASPFCIPMFVCGWPDPTLGSDAVKAPCKPSSPAMGLAFGAPYKKASFPHVSGWWRHSDLASCICDLWTLLEPLQPPWGEGSLSACFCGSGAARPASRLTLYLCYAGRWEPEAATVHSVSFVLFSFVLFSFSPIFV